MLSQVRRKLLLVALSVPLLHGISTTPVFCADLKFNGPMISLDLRDADIHSVLKIFADINHVNIVAHPDVQGKVKRLRLIDVPADQAFDIILKTYGLFAVNEGNVTIVYPLKTYLQDAGKRR